MLSSESLTKDVLIVYAEGLACQNLDKKKMYDVRRHDKDSCCVLKKSAGEEGEPTSTNQPFFN